MKRSLVILAGLATLGMAALLGSQLFAQQQPQVGAAPASPKIGLLNMAYVLKGYNKFKTYNDEIEHIRVQFEKRELDLQKLIKQWQDYGTKAGATQAEREQAEDAIKKCKREIEDNNTAFTKARSKKSDEQMVQMYREIEDAVKRFAASNGFHLVFHYSEPLTDADKMSAPNIQRKLVGPGGSGGVCPTYFVGSMDISADLVNTLNAMYPAPVASGPAGGQPPTQPAKQ